MLSRILSTIADKPPKERLGARCHGTPRARISHDLLWERDYGDFEECVARSPLGIHEFWSAAADDPEFPVDSYDAARVWREK